MSLNKKLYFFVSDVHLGLDVLSPREREKKFVAFLDSLPKETEALYLLGDIFDFWYEYKYVAPKGFTRTLGKLARLVDSGVKVYFFKGNHDLWTFGYLEDEIGLKVLKQPCLVDIEGFTFCLGHGDGLGPGDTSYKFLRSIFHSKLLQILFSNIHPRWAYGLAHSWSKHNRLSKGESYKFRGESESIYKFANEFGKSNKVDYYIFGHLHNRTQISIPSGGEMFIMGEWIHSCDYLCFDGVALSVGYLVNREK